MAIHPTAIIEEGAEIGEGTTIGPYCHVGAHVRLGKNNILHSHVVLDGKTLVGDNNEFFSFACIGKKTQDLKYGGGLPGVNIGSNNSIREYATIHCATYDDEYTTVGDNCLIQAYCHVAHDCQLADHVILSSGAKLSGHCELGKHAIISGMTGVIQFVKVGDYAFVGGYAKLTHDVPHYCIADGIPAKIVMINKVGLERNGFSKEGIKKIYRAYKTAFNPEASMEDNKASLAEHDNEFARHMLNFLGESKKGVLLR